jgi:hypothetical protein
MRLWRSETGVHIKQRLPRLIMPHKNEFMKAMEWISGRPALFDDNLDVL